MKLAIFMKEYDGESIVDVSRDVFECFHNRFNPIAAQIPTDEHGFHEGIFTVTVEWRSA